MHIWRSLRPDGAPCIFHLEYDPETLKIKKGLMFPLSPELDDEEPLDAAGQTMYRESL